MNDKPIKTPEDLKKYIREAQEERAQLQAQAEEARELSEKTARDLVEYQVHELLATDRGAERVYRLAEEHRVSVEAAARYLSPKPVSAPRSADSLDEGTAADYDVWGFSAGEITELARGENIPREEAARRLARQTKPREA